MRYVFSFILSAILLSGHQPLLCQSGSKVLMVDMIGYTIPSNYFLGAGVSYRASLSPKWELGGGLGLHRIEQVGRPNGKSGLKTWFLVPLHATYSWKTSRHRPISEIGVLGHLIYNGNGLELFPPSPFVSAGYGFTGERLVLRLPLRFLYSGGPLYSILFPRPALSIGIRLPAKD